MGLVGGGGGGGGPIKEVKREPRQGLTLVPFSARRKRFLRDRGCIHGWFRGCVGVLGGIRGGQDVFCVRNGSG